MNDRAENRSPDVPGALEVLAKRVRRLTLAVIFMAIVLFLLVAITFLYLVDWHADEPLLSAGASLGAALVGFGLGWFARKKE